jgi:hypothetical protein
MGDFWQVLAGWARLLITATTGDPELETACLVAGWSCGMVSSVVDPNG